MFGLGYYKAEPTTYVIRTKNGKTQEQGKGLSFFYATANTTIAAIPVNTQEAPFIFNLQTADHQAVTVQGQISYRVSDPEKLAEMLNFSLRAGTKQYSSEDPMQLSDRVVRSAHSVVQNKVQTAKLKEVFAINAALASLIQEQLSTDIVLGAMGLAVLNVMVANIKADPETSRALEAEAREAILKESDDAIYDRRKAAVEQERLIKEAELQTDLSVQQKEQEIATSRLDNEREILRGEAKTNAERLQANIEMEAARKDLVSLKVDNQKQEADAEAYAVTARMEAFSTLPVENLKAMAMANMDPEQLMAMAFESLADNAGKIGELTITPDLFSHLMKSKAS